MGWTPLHLAAMFDYFDICNLIIKDIENQNPANRHGQTPLHLAAKYGHLKTSEFLMNLVDDKSLENDN